MKWDARRYDEKYNFVYKYGEALVTMLNPKPDERILDIGCGTGYLTSRIAEKCRNVTGIDLSETMIATAKKNYPDINFIVADATVFRDEKGFDGIFSNATLHWISDQEGLNNNLYALLKKGGRLIVEFGGKDNVAVILNTLREVLASFGYQRQANQYPWYYPSVGQYAAALEKAGFRVLKAEHYDRPTPLADEKDSLENWIDMFGTYFFEGVSEIYKMNILAEVSGRLKPRCFVNGRWIADYKRIRVHALKKQL